MMELGAWNRPKPSAEPSGIFELDGLRAVSALCGGRSGVGDPLRQHGAQAADKVRFRVATEPEGVRELHGYEAVQAFGL